MVRDNFDEDTKTSLAKRAGNICSFPGCDASTAGPSEESAVAVANTGEAAHISAASGGRGARRWISVLSPEYRSSIDNGIWCCRTHAKLIDTDEVTFSIPMLRQWRKLAEERARLRQAYGANFDLTCRNELAEIGLAPDLITLAPEYEVNAKIGAAVINAWLAEIFGKDAADTVRDFLIEHVRNAFTHGRARSVEVKFDNRAIEVSDDGEDFSICNLSGPEARGGGIAYREMLKSRHLGHASSKRKDNKNFVHIPFVLNIDELPCVNPCALKIDWSQLREKALEIEKFKSCDKAFIVAPDFAVYSDGFMYVKALEEFIQEHPKVVLIFPKASARVIEYYSGLFPTAKVEGW